MIAVWMLNHAVCSAMEPSEPWVIVEALCGLRRLLFEQCLRANLLEGSNIVREKRKHPTITL